jgi:hypothetical protein
MTCRKALECGEINARKCEVTLQTLQPVVRLFMERDGPKAPTAVHGPLGITYYLNKKANMSADCLQNQFISNNLCDENHE